MANIIKNTRADAFKQKKGDLYQFAYAVKICLNAKKGERIQIEHHGDISSDNLYSYEIKKYESNFTFQTNQFWNTLYNWIFDIDVYNDYNNLILLTTSDTKDFDKINIWNKSSPDEKFEVLQKLIPTIKSRKNVSERKLAYIDYIFEFNQQYTKQNLLEILGKVEIILNSVSASSINDELMSLECFKYDTKEDKRILINAAKAFVLDSGLNKDKWVIETNELHEILRRKKANKKHQLKRISELEDLIYSDYSEYNFVQEIRKINLEKEDIDEAIKNYYIASEQIQDIIQEFPNIPNYNTSLTDFSTSLLRNLRAIKKQSRYELSSDIQKLNYFKSLRIELKNIELIENDECFQIGNIHKVVDENKHNWLIDENK